MREVSTPMNDPRYPEIKQNRNAVSKKSSQVDIGGLATASYHLPSEQCVFFHTIFNPLLHRDSQNGWSPPSGKRLHNYGASPWYYWETHHEWAMFNCKLLVSHYQMVYTSRVVPTPVLQFIKQQGWILHFLISSSARAAFRRRSRLSIGSIAHWKEQRSKMVSSL